MDEQKVLLAQIGTRIRSIRMNKNISQLALSAQCDFEKASLSRIESGKTNATILTLHKISVALDVPMIEFFKQ
jgi:transcriptional regulator with XRE-family HTH domain